MNRFITLICLLFACAANASFTKYATVNIYTNPHVGSVIAIDGATVTWTNNTGATVYWVQTTNTSQNAATNLYTKLNLLSFTNVAKVSYSNETNLVIEAILNSPLTVTLSGPGGTNWGTVTYSTNNYATAYRLTLPLLTGNVTNQHTNIHNDVVDLLNYANATNKPSTNGPMWASFPDSRRGANPTFTNLSTIGGTNKPTDFLGTNGGIRNMWASNFTVTNLSAPGIGGATSLQLGSDASAETNQTVVIGITSTNRGQQTIVVGDNSFVGPYGFDSVLLGHQNVTTNHDTIIIGAGWTITNNNMAIIATAGVGGSLNTANFGPMADNQLWLTSDGESLWVPGASHFQKSLFFTNAWATNLYAFRAFVSNATIAAVNAWVTNLTAYNANLTNVNISVKAGYMSNVIANFFQATNPIVWGNIRMGDTNTGNNSTWALKIGTNLAGVSYFQVYNDDALAGSFNQFESAGQIWTTIGNSAANGDSLTNHGAFWSDSISTPTLTVTQLTSTVHINTNSIYYGTNVFRGGIITTITNTTGLSSGDVLLDLSPNCTVVELSGYGATMNICGIKNGTPGRQLKLVGTNVFNIVLRNLSSAAGTADSEKIFTGTGADVTRTNVPKVINLLYLGTKWINDDPK